VVGIRTINFRFMKRDFQPIELSLKMFFSAVLSGCLPQLLEDA
jgi:hypothetical protein